MSPDTGIGTELPVVVPFPNCPYWFDPDFEEEARLCFPSKIASYLASGRTLFFHGPAHSAPARFLNSQDAGVVCDSLDPNVIIKMVTQAIEPKEFAQLCANGRRAFHDDLTLQRVALAFHSLLNTSRIESGVAP